MIVNPGFPPFVPPTHGQAPELPAHCIDTGVPNVSVAPLDPWSEPPTWRQAPATLASAHPDVTTTFAFNRFPGAPDKPLPEGNLRTMKVALPAGFVGIPTATDRCSGADFGQVPPRCPPASQLGVLTSTVNGFVVSTFLSPIYNLVPRGGKVAEFGVAIGELTSLRIGVEATPTAISAQGTYELAMKMGSIPAGMPMLSSTLTLWGVPYAAVHDAWRAPTGVPSIDPAVGVPLANQQHYQSSWGAIRPFLTSPSRCGGDAPVTRLSIDSWQNQGAFQTYESRAEDALEGCSQVPFDPAVSIEPEAAASATPTGLTVDLDLPQHELPSELGTSPLRNAVVKLPAGMSVSPSAADGLGGCSDAQVGIGSELASSCPDNSKIGTVTVTTPLLDGPIEGAVYLGSQTAGQLLRLFLVIDDPDRGLRVKIRGRIDPDPHSGQLSVVLEDSPQLPIAHLRLQLRDGPRALLVTPGACGDYSADYSLGSWSGKAVQGSSSFTIDRNCGRQSQFAPGFEAGVTNPVAGRWSPFTLRVTREDGQQNLAAIEVKLPAGLTAKLAGVPLCGEAEAATGACPAASRVGGATVGIGAGTNPLYVPQAGRAPTAAYLAGPYKGAPYSLVVKVPLLAGPFDLGTFAVRAAVDVDPETAQVLVKSDPLPQILQGIPIAYRDVRVRIDGADLIRNPTSCSPMSVDTTITSSQGATATRSSRFQVADCERLAFKPKLALRFSGAPNRRGGYPALKAVLTAGKGEANIGKAAVILPKTELLEQAHIRTICTPVQFAAEACPKASAYGYAKAWTPLLDRPLEGPVYLRANGGDRELPDLVADLGGQIDVELVGYIDTVKKKGAGISRIRTRFVSIPDAPVSKFVLDMQGGRKGLLANNTNLCKAKPRAEAKFDGHNGKVHDINPLVKLSCGKKGK